MKEVTNKDMSTKRIATQFDGRKALIKEGHPHAGETAKCIGAERTDIGYGLVFSPEQGDEFFVFEPKDIKWLSQE